MSKRTGVKSGNAENSDPGFLSRWSARKTEIATAAANRKDSIDKQNQLERDHSDQESDEEAALSDNELLKKYELPDPNDVDEEVGLDRFFDGKIPERLRQMALRRLWRINPLFGIVDEMVEYGEDYTDAATVIDGMQTAYQAGKGYLKKVVEGGEDDNVVENSDAQMDQDTQADQELDAGDERQKNDVENQSDTCDGNRDGFGGEAEQEFTGTSSAENASLKRSDSLKTSSGDKDWDEVSHVDRLAPEEENKIVSEPAEKNAKLTKPKRMQFRLNS